MQKLLSQIKIVTILSLGVFSIAFNNVEGAVELNSKPALPEVAWCSVSRLFGSDCVDSIKPKFLVEEKKR